MPSTQVLTLGKPPDSLMCGTRAGRHDVKVLPAVGKLAISNVSHHHTSPDRARKTRPDQTSQDRPVASKTDLRLIPDQP
eukprot:8415459-Alexandrium_andersonii.AAC.1